MTVLTEEQRKTLKCGCDMIGCQREPVFMEFSVPLCEEHWKWWNYSDERREAQKLFGQFLMREKMTVR